MSLCPYLTDSERHILPVETQDQYRYFAAFNLRGVSTYAGFRQRWIA